VLNYFRSCRVVDVVDVNCLKQFETILDWTAEITGTGDRSEFKLETVSESSI